MHINRTCPGNRMITIESALCCSETDMRISALCLEFPGNHKVPRKSALCQMSKSRPGLFRLWRVGCITILAVEAVKGVVLPEGEDCVPIAVGGNDNECHGLAPFDRSILSDRSDTQASYGRTSYNGIITLIPCPIQDKNLLTFSSNQGRTVYKKK